MPDGVELREFVCPSCAAQTRLDARFVQWCTNCGFNADPNPPVLSKRRQRRAEREYERSRKLFESLRTARNLRPTSATGVSVTLLSGVVHLIGLAVLALPILYVALEGGGFLPGVILVLCLLTFLTVRPRLPQREQSDKAGIDRTQAPRFYELLDRCAAELGCAVPERVGIDLRFNAATGRVGLRRRSYLILGMPLWNVLSGQERIALLGHELAHQVNGDTTHGLWAASARRSLHEWTKLLDPRQTNLERRSNQRIARRSRRGGLGGLMGFAAPIVMAVLFSPFFVVALGCRVGLQRLDLYCGQRAEYLADELGARLAGSDAAYGLLAKLGLAEPVQGFLSASKNRLKTRRENADGLWTSVTGYVDSIPETEQQRRKIVDRARNTRTDRSHPANHLRIALIEARPQLPGVLKLSEDEWAAIDAELAPGYAGAARALLSS